MVALSYFLFDSEGGPLNGFPHLPGLRSVEPMEKAK